MIDYKSIEDDQLAEHLFQLDFRRTFAVLQLLVNILLTGWVFGVMMSARANVHGAFIMLLMIWAAFFVSSCGMMGLKIERMLYQRKMRQQSMPPLPPPPMPPMPKRVKK